MVQAEPIKTAAGYAGRRRHLTPQTHVTSSGASMPLTRHSEAVCFVPEAGITHNDSQKSEL